MSTMITRPDLIQLARLQAMKGALRLETLGLRNSRVSVYALVKREFGFRGNKQRVLDQLIKLIAQREQETGICRLPTDVDVRDLQSQMRHDK